MQHILAAKVCFAYILSGVSAHGNFSVIYFNAIIMNMQVLISCIGIGEI